MPPKQRFGLRSCLRIRTGFAALVALGLLATISPGWAAVLGDCGAAGTTDIATIRGNSTPQLAEGTPVVVEAVITGSFTGDDRLRGFYLQQSAPRAGIFVYAPDMAPEVAPQAGERWRILAETGRYRGRVQLEWVEDWRSCGREDVSPALLDPRDTTAYEQYEDQLVRLDRSTTVADVYSLGRFGSLRLAVNGRPFASNNGVSGGELLPLLLDDGSYRRDPRPVPYLDQQGVRRVGDQLQAPIGILTQAFGQWRLHPTAPVVFVSLNSRPQTPPAAQGLRVVQLNLRNYFLDRGSRGAETAAAFARQRARLQALIRPLDADVLVLHEIQNNPEAVDDLLALLNSDQPSSQHYRAAVEPRSPAAIRSVALYRERLVSMRRAARIVDPIHPRDPIAVEWETPAGDSLVIIAAHFKSRGGCPDTGDTDQGEGCWAERRAAQSNDLIDWAQQTWQVSPERTSVLVLADFNAYAEESAMKAWQQAGFVDLLAERIAPEDRYTYVFRGRSGYLDHALATPALLNRIEAVRLWAVNADEPAYLGFEGEGIWRASDHDPIIIDFALPRSGAE